MIKRKSSTPARSHSRWRTYFLITVCGLLTVSGFFFAGRQHFSWMDYGMRNSKLRKQIDDLQAEKRRLLLAREVSLSPGEIKKAAKKVGFGEPQEVQTSSTTYSPTKELASATNKTPSAPDAKAMVVKTVAVSPAGAVTPASLRRAERIVTPASKPVKAE